MSDKLAKKAESKIAVPDYIVKGDTRGTEHITQEDLQIPRIALAQGLSPQLNETDPKYIEGLKMGEMFNNITGENYHKGPIDFTVVRADKPRGVEFFPLDEGGGVKDLNVPLNDPRMDFGPDGKKPQATKFYDFVILMIPSLEPIALSFKGTGLKVAKTLNALMKMRNAPSFAVRYSLTSAIQTNNKGTFGIYVVKYSTQEDEFSTKVGDKLFVSDDVYKYAESMYENIKDKELIVERESDAVEGAGIEDDSKPPF